jgi:hypothetical protein
MVTNQMVKTLDAMSQEGFRKSIATLNGSVAQAVRDIDRRRGARGRPGLLTSRVGTGTN